MTQTRNTKCRYDQNWSIFPKAYPADRYSLEHGHFVFISPSASSLFVIENFAITIYCNSTSLRLVTLYSHKKSKATKLYIEIAKYTLLKPSLYSARVYLTIRHPFALSFLWCDPICPFTLPCTWQQIGIWSLA